MDNLNLNDSDDGIARYVVVVEIDSVFVAHCDDIEYVCSLVNEYIEGGSDDSSIDAAVRPLSSMIAC